MMRSHSNPREEFLDVGLRKTRFLSFFLSLPSSRGVALHRRSPRTDIHLPLGEERSCPRLLWLKIEATFRKASTHKTLVLKHGLVLKYVLS